MVHALEEVWKVVKPGGMVVDLRPISLDVPLFILTPAGWMSAGLPDQSPDRVHDRAANRAVRAVVQAGLLRKVKQAYFTTHYYWNNLKELKKDVEESWKDDIIVSKEIWKQARLLFKESSGMRCIRFPLSHKLVMYQRLGV